LLPCYDAPILLYYKGIADLNLQKIISIVGTRRFSEYGKQITEKLIRDLMPYQVLVVSGLAFGIDAIAHKAALKQSLQTIGVLAHGLHTFIRQSISSFRKRWPVKADC
jgi:DNA processing protein